MWVYASEGLDSYHLVLATGTREEVEATVRTLLYDPRFIERNTSITDVFVSDILVGWMFYSPPMYVYVDTQGEV